MTGNEKGRVVTVPDSEIPSLKIIGQPHCEFIVQFSQAPPCAKLRPPLRGQRDFFKPGHRVVLVLQTEAALSLIDPPDDGFLGDLLVAQERLGVSLNPPQRANVPDIPHGKTGRVVQGQNLRGVRTADSPHIGQSVEHDGEPIIDA